MGPRAVPALVAAAGIGLIGSGVFVTDPLGDFPPVTGDEHGSNYTALPGTAPTREGTLHNVCAVPIFAGIPLASLASAVAAARSRQYRWACYSALSSLVMAGSFLLFGRAFGGVQGLAGKSGILQRISIASGFGWLTALSIRAGVITTPSLKLPNLPSNVGPAGGLGAASLSSPILPYPRLRNYLS